MSICDAINQGFKKRIFPLPDNLQPLPELVENGTRCIMIEPCVCASGVRVGDICIWNSPPNDDLPVCDVGMGRWCIDKGCLMLAP